jgi:hypothetical protein
VAALVNKLRFYIEPMIFTLTCINVIASGVFFIGYVWPYLQNKNYQAPEWLYVFDSLGESFFNVPIFPLAILTMLYSTFRDTGRGCIIVLWALTIPSEIYRFTDRPIDWYFAVMILIVFIIFVCISLKYVFVNR